MNAEQEEVVARKVLQDLKRNQSLEGKAQGDWRRGMSAFVIPVVICAVVAWGPEDTWDAAGIVFAIALVALGYELFLANRRIDALLKLHERLERRMENVQGSTPNEDPQ